MDELISKRAVIEAIEKARANVGHNLERSIGKSIIEILDDVGRDVDRLPSAHGTNLAEVGTDLISRQQAIKMCREPRMRNADCSDFEMEIMMLPPIQSDIPYIISETLHECGIYGEEATVKLIGTLKRLRRDDLLPPCVR